MGATMAPPGPRPPDTGSIPIFGDVPPQNVVASMNTLEGMSKAVLTAVAWPYANGPRHIGHVSGFGVPSDVFARYRRMAGTGC